MEQLNQFYQEELSNSYFPLEQTTQGMTQLELNQFIQKLLTTIELSELAELYFQQLKTTLQLSGLKIQYQDNMLELGEQVKNSHQKSLKCMESNLHLATIIYSFPEQMSLRSWQILQQMHVNFSYPLKNALDFQKVKQFAMKDFLTSLGNRASYEEAIVRVISQSERHNAPFGLLVLDMDNFKQVNDTHGHQEGDKVLVTCAKTIQNCLRDSDFAFRFGGDEFCCLLPEADSRINGLIAERIRHAIEATPLLKTHNISCSIGTATYQDNDNQLSMFSRADEALYRAKRTGKNCIKAA
ncbi:GGDEF domain-containing protein [Paraglaciecola aquimarina]|uniref:diguanylate cyclase n=1 Tax=Paraglaciecola algarum TaxID=3050085 RepID=A0ABS9D5D5_9ALTE|nr:GGDEF domain-containing protein [Paraglaciecola sp. G1-23]MCF2948177.1 GGDEF domain-containing protein [Paraglaciecola sp. G1-23]